MPAADKPSIPKFTSFRSQASRTKTNRTEQFEEPDRRTHQPSQDEVNVSNAGSRTSRSGKGIRDKEIDQGSRAEYERSHHHSESPSLSRGRDEVYKVDLHGDLQNLRYGKLHKYSIPQYRRTGSGFVLGLERRARIERNSEDLVLASCVPNATKPLRHDLRHWNDTETSRIVRPSECEEAFNVHEDFVSLLKGKKRKQTGGDGSTTDVSEFRDLQNADQSLAISEDSDTGADAESSAAAQHSKDSTEITEKSTILRRAVTQNPQDLGSWLSLVDHQEAVLLGTRRGQRRLTGSEQRALADIRSSIYDQAIKAVTDEGARLTLIVGHMDEVAEILDDVQLSQKWESLLNQYPDAVELWIRYLDFLQTHFIAFQFDICSSAFLRALKTVSSAIKNPQMNEGKLRDLQKQWAYIFLRLTLLVRQAGYSELATALWQGIFEFTAFLPQHLKGQSITERLAAFEEFWESEAPRFGEPGALGWCNSGHTLPESPNLDKVQMSKCSASEPFERFAAEEARAAELLRLPGRASDDNVSDDPYHTILFSDIKDHVACAPSQISSPDLIQGYLQFAGLPPVPGGDLELTRKWGLDPFLQDMILSSSEATQSPLRASCFIQTTDTLFSTAFNPACLTEEVSWVRHALAQLVKSSVDGIHLAEYYLAFLLHCSPGDEGLTNAVKAARAFLKERPADLRLYNALGLIEAQRSSSKSQKIFSTALSLRKSLPENSESDAILLRRTWIWESLRAHDWQGARAILFTVGQTPAVDTNIDRKHVRLTSSAELLRIRTALTDIRDHVLALRKSHDAVLATDCLALLAYLESADNWDLDAALSVYDSTERELDEIKILDSQVYEDLYQARTQFLMHHVAHSHHYKPAIIRRDLQKSLRRFPLNTIILSAYATLEARFRIDDRVRAAVSEILYGQNMHQQKDSIITHAFAIASEMQRVQDSTGTVHAVRAAFQRAAESRSCKHAPAFWFAYLQFELCYAKAGTESMKSVFLEGMTRLPWCKKFMMEGFSTTLRQVMARDQLIHVFNVMEEKGLRMFVDLRGLLEQRPL